MSQEFSIALDAMGGDHGPSVVVPAALQILAESPRLCIILVGDESVLNEELSTHKQAATSSIASRLSIQHASQQVAMDEKPSIALRTKKDSSMRVAINLVKEGNCQGLCKRRQYRCLDGNGTLCAKNTTGH